MTERILIKFILIQLLIIALCVFIGLKTCAEANIAMLNQLEILKHKTIIQNIDFGGTPVILNPEAKDLLISYCRFGGSKP